MSALLTVVPNLAFALLRKNSCHFAHVFVRQVPRVRFKPTSPAFTPPSARELTETSGYPALSNLLNAIGDTLKPKITAVNHPANNGAGIPDGGLSSSNELKMQDHNPSFAVSEGPLS